MPTKGAHKRQTKIKSGEDDSGCSYVLEKRTKYKFA